MVISENLSNTLDFCNFFSSTKMFIFLLFNIYNILEVKGVSATDYQYTKGWIIQWAIATTCRFSASQGGSSENRFSMFCS